MTLPYAEPLAVKSLSEPVVPEPPRPGEPGGPPCPICAGETGHEVVWEDERWRLGVLRGTPVAGVCMLVPKRHADGIADLDDVELAELGPLCARVSRALYARGDVGRVMVSTFGDGTAHLHVWIAPRPLGALDLRGSFYWVWFDHLPPLPDAEIETAIEDLRRRLNG